MGRNKEMKLRRRSLEKERGGEEKSRASQRKNNHSIETPRAKQPGMLKKAWRFLIAHPFLAITLIIGLPRAIPWSYHWMHLRSGVLGAVVKVEDERQTLILGSMGSGTTQMSKEINKLGFEVAHEVSDSMNEYCRQGTISWAHAIRFLSGRPNLALLCAAPRFNSFHSTMFKPSSKCSSLFRVWDQCWARECRQVTAQEYGCALAEGGGSQCVTPFKTSLLQVRHPLHTIASLAYKSSGSKESLGVDCSNAEHQLAAVMSLFPSKAIRVHYGLPNFEWETLSTCVEMWAWYWVIYNKALLPHVDAWYPVEYTPPAKVASMAGFVGETIDKALLEASEGQGSGQGEMHGYHNRKNTGNFTVTWEDIAAYPGGLLEEMLEMAKTFGYDVSGTRFGLPVKGSQELDEIEDGIFINESRSSTKEESAGDGEGRARGWKFWRLSKKQQ